MNPLAHLIEKSIQYSTATPNSRKLLEKHGASKVVMQGQDGYHLLYVGTLSRGVLAASALLRGTP